MSRRARRRLQIGTPALTGIIALSAYAGVVGLVGGAISFDETINARLPYQSLSLLLVVAVPMTAAAVDAFVIFVMRASRSNASLKATGSDHDHFQRPKTDLAGANRRNCCCGWFITFHPALTNGLHRP